MLGELHEGRAATREALAWSQRRNQLYLEAELWRVDGELARVGWSFDLSTPWLVDMAIRRCGNR